MPKSVDKRHDAIASINGHFLNKDNGYVVEGTEANRILYVNMIEGLRSLGRTERWQACITNTKFAARDTDNDFGWVIRQYGIYLGYAAL